MKTTIQTILIAAVVSTAALPALAQPGERDVRTTHITARDLDLSRPSDARIMASRIKQAALGVCGERVRVEMVERERHQACVAEAIRSTLKQVNAPLVSAHFDAMPNATLAAR